MNTSNEFQSLLKVIQMYQVEQQIHSEHDMESGLMNYLKTEGYDVDRQTIVAKYRNDLVVKINNKKICLELKVTAGINIDKQIDNYIPYYKDGIIIVCWNASKNLQRMVELVTSKISQPIAIIELRKGQSLV